MHPRPVRQGFLSGSLHLGCQAWRCGREYRLDDPTPTVVLLPPRKHTVAQPTRRMVGTHARAENLNSKGRMMHAFHQATRLPSRRPTTSTTRLARTIRAALAVGVSTLCLTCGSHPEPRYEMHAETAALIVVLNRESGELWAVSAGNWIPWGAPPTSCADSSDDAEQLGTLDSVRRQP
jgi:hypothetical protein